MIYLDYAATTPLDDGVLGEMLPYLKENFGNPQSLHSAGRNAGKALVSARDEVARVLGCKSENVYFLSGGTEAGNLAVKGVCAARKKGHLIVSAIEHPAVLESARAMTKFGFELTEIQPDGGGVIPPQKVLEAIRPDTVFCAVMAVNNELGTIQPAQEIGKICRERGVFYYCDCVQSAGRIAFPTENCSALAISAHKFYGPKGVAAMYIAPNSGVEGLISGGRQERGLRGGTVNVAAAAGLAAALNRAVKSEDNQRLAALKGEFIGLVTKKIKGAQVNGDLSRSVPSIVNISFEGISGANLAACLDTKGICVSTGSACSAGAPVPSYVVTAVAGKERANGAVRFSFGKYTTREEIVKTVEALEEIFKLK